MQKEGIVAIVATKNRTNLLKRALESISLQTKQPLAVCVSSDSNQENEKEEKELCSKYGYKYIKDKYSHNYAGNLNTALEKVFEEYIYENRYDASNLYIAFLDDDDVWNKNYLRECWNTKNNQTDIVVCGLNYHSDDKMFPLEIPHELNIDSFLKGNPHIQGSNTFVRFSTLLKAGCFDENMDSTTDRDLFTRLFMLNPNIEIVDKYLVEVDASNNRNRLTNNKEGKQLSFAKFYYKYSGLMSNEVKKEFFNRVNHFCDVNNEKQLLDTLNKKIEISINQEENVVDDLPLLCFSFITTDINYAKRLINDIVNVDYPNKKIIIFANLEQELEINNTNIEINILSLTEVRKLALDNYFDKFVIDNFKPQGIVKEISVARSILQYYVYNNTKEGDVIYILDEDMQLSSFHRINNRFETRKANIKLFVSRYLNKFDAVIGSYAYDAPIPALSTLRTSLLDYVYAKKLNKNNLVQEKLYYNKDYYYAFSNEGNVCNETPFPLIEDCTLNEVLSGKAISRPLFETNLCEYEPTRRGGNTLIFNRKLLLMPNISIKIGDYISRRGDSLWVNIAKEKGYKIIGSTFSLMQNRISYDFDFEKELKKEALDILGYSMISAIVQKKTSSREEFYNSFITDIKERTVRFSMSYFRVIGLLEILKDERFNYLIDDGIIYNFIRKIKELTYVPYVNAGFDELKSYLELSERKAQLDTIKEFLINKCNCNNPVLVDYGFEGAIYNVGNKTYKVFFKKDNLEFFKSTVDKLNTIEGFPRNIMFNDSLDYAYCSYDIIDNFKKYNGGFSKELANFISKLRLNGLVINNFKKENIIITNNQPIYIDLGKDIIPYNEKDYNKSLERCYQMIRYSYLDKHQFKILIAKSYYEQDKPFNYSLDVFNELTKNRKKEQIHDVLILDLIKKHNPGTILDYGAGKCKIANSLAGDFNTFVYDIDKETINKRAGDKVIIIDDIGKVNKTFDLINCNKVLCCTDNVTNEDIMNNINRLLSIDGRLILSICNPFFDNVDKTETTLENHKGKYEDCNLYQKVTIYGTRNEYHRSFNYYKRLLEKHGFKIDNVYEDNGIDVESLSFIGEHLIFDCHKIDKPILSDCSLLIKANPMEANVIYDCVKHIVSQLERKEMFYERILTVDISCIDRARRYESDDINKFNQEINRLKNDGFIDRIVKLEIPNDYLIYDKYFNLSSDNVHSLNGQGLLATLKGFESCNTRYVFQTDSDIIYFNDEVDSLGYALQTLKDNKAITLSLSIAHDKKGNIKKGNRVEVRSSFVDLERLKEMLPLPNQVENRTLKDTWHRSLDKVIDKDQSIRLTSNHLFFIHPENQTKKIENFVGVVRNQIERNMIPTTQLDNVNLVYSDDWYEKITKEVVLFIRGRNTPVVKLKRLFDSLKNQEFSNYQIVYFDDNSTNLSSSEYVEMLMKHSSFFKDRLLYFKNNIRVGASVNFECFYKRVCVNPKSIIINIDNDDALISKDAISIIKEKFDNGSDVTVGNCLRLDKPLKKYNLVSFKESWKRDGDNIWLHPKCFRRYLCEYIQDGLLRDGKYIEVANDYATMLPIVENAYNPTFIEKQIYLFDISKESINKMGVYTNNAQQEMKQWLLNRQEKINKHKTIAIIGDSSIKPNSEEYKIAFELGKSLVEHGYNIKNGGLGGVMEAGFKGAKTATNYRKGSTIAIIPSKNKNEANQYADIVIPTGLDILRNGMVVEADAVVVVGGGAGTLSEIAIAWQKYKLIIALTNCDGWGKKLAGTKLDNRIRYANISDDCIYQANSVEQVIKLLEEKIDLYNKKYHGIKWRKNV